MPRRGGIKLDSRKMSLEMSTFNERANNTIARMFDFQAQRSTGRMKTEAPWTDRTSNARNGLAAIPKSSERTHILLLTHGMSYGIYLELSNSGRYAIVLPEIPRAAADIQRMLEKLFAQIPRR